MNYSSMTTPTFGDFVVGIENYTGSPSRYFFNTFNVIIVES
jgi:hypothetical protein